MKNISLLLLVWAATAMAASAQQPSGPPTGGQPPTVGSSAVCVVGNVAKPSLLPIEGGITLTEAISKAGGALPDSRSNSVRVHRSFRDRQEMITIKELRAVERGRAKDVELRAGDIVEVVPRDRRKAVPQARGTPCPSKSHMSIL